MGVSTVYIREQYFWDNPNLEKILDKGNVDKQAKRAYLFLKVEYEGNNILVPLKTNVEPVRQFGKRHARIGYSVPSEKRPNAGLDFRYIMIVNEEKYLEFPQSSRLPKSQNDKLENDYSTIENMVISYVEGYVKKAVKGRTNEPKFRMSTLVNYHKELKIDEKLKGKDIEVAADESEIKILNEFHTRENE